MSVYFVFNYCPLISIYTVLVQIHTPSIIVVAAARISTIGRREIIPGRVGHFHLLTHPLGTPIFTLLVPIAFSFRDCRVKFDTPKFLAMAAIVLGLILGVGLLGATF